MNGPDPRLSCPLLDHEKVTRDSFLGGRLTICQPRDGFRAGLDSVLLAASLTARPGETVFEPGAGVGTVALCAASRLDGVRIIGLELDETACALAQANIAENGLGERVSILAGDIQAPPPAIAAAGFDQVVLNPPYGSPDEGNRSPHAARARAHAGEAAGPDLDEWLAFSMRRLKPKGRLTLIHRADKLDRILKSLTKGVGEIVVFPLWPAAGEAAKRVMVTGRKGLQTGAKLSPGLVLHGSDGGPTPALQAITRDGAGLSLS